MDKNKSAEEIYNDVFKKVSCYHFPELKQLVSLAMEEYKNQELTTLQQANAELENWKSVAEQKFCDLFEIRNKLEKHNAELTEIARAYYEHLKRQDAETGLNVYSDRMKQRIFEAVQSHESNKQP